ncbi:MAG: RNA polymerase sigma factor [Bdellovibrionota bacterium]
MTIKDPQREAWLALTMQHWEPRLHRYCSRFVRAEVAAEIVQETFTRLWNETQDLAGREQPWLFHVSRNLCIDHIRREKKTILKEVEGVLVPETETQLENQQQATELQRITSTLPPAQREVVRLKFQEDMSYQQISEVTGYSISYVGVLIHEAMIKIRKQYSKKEISS